MPWDNEDSKNLNRIRRQTSKTPVFDSIIDIMGTMAKKEEERDLEKVYIKSKISLLSNNNETYIKTVDNGMEYEQRLLKMRMKYRLPALYYLADYSEKSNAKIYNSCKNYNYEYHRNGEYFLAVFDDTLMGSADVGFVLTSRRIIVKKQSQDYPRTLELSKIDRIIAYNNDVVVNGGDLIIPANFLNSQEKKEEFCRMINELKKMYKEFVGKGECVENSSDSVRHNSELDSKAVDKTVSALRKLKELVDEGILTEEEYIAKKKKMLDI